MKVSNLHQLFLHELSDLYSAEKQIIKALPTMIDAATDTDLREELQNHLMVTEEQLLRLKEISEEYSFNKNHECLGIKGIIQEDEEGEADKNLNALAHGGIFESGINDEALDEMEANNDTL